MALVIRTTGLEQYAPGGEARLKLLIIGGPGAGKRLDVNTRVATPQGWQRFGDLAIGDQVIGASGEPTTVTGIYDEGRGPACQIFFNDGASIVADAEHQWSVWTRKLREDGKPPIILTTQQIIERGVRSERDGHKSRYEFFLPLVQPVQYDKVDLPIGPYLLGTLLANGSFTSDVVNFTTNDETVATRCIAENPQLDITEATYETSTARSWRIRQLHPVLTLLGIDRQKSAQKSVPALYLIADEQARRDLLAGLMDGDGSASPAHRARYHTTSRRLAENVQELIRSLGGVARVTETPRDGYIEYSVAVWLPQNPFTLPRKADNYSPDPWFRAIESIEGGVTASMRCITVDAPDELYVVADYIVTHNTRYASFFPRPIYADCEGGLASVADRNVPYVHIATSDDMLDLLQHLKQECTMPKNRRTYDTIVIDTIDAYQRKLKNEWMERNKAPTFAGWEAWGFLNQKLGLMLTRLLNLDMNVIVNVHYKDKVFKDDETGKESHELQLQLQGETSDTAFNDFDQVGWLGTYWEAEAGERVQKRGLTFKPTPDKPFLKDRLHVTPNWLPVTFADSDYEGLLKLVSQKIGDLNPSEQVGQIESADPSQDIPGLIRTPSEVQSGALPVKEIPVSGLDKPSLLAKARELGITKLLNGTPIRGNTVRSELIAVIEAKQNQPLHLDAHENVAEPDVQPAPPAAAAVPPSAPAKVTVPRQSQAPSVEQVAEGLVDTRTGELLEPNGGGVDTLERPAPSVQEAVNTVAESLGGKVMNNPPPAPPAPAPAQTAASPAPAPEKPAQVCEDCGKDLAEENPDFVKLAWIKYRRRLCQADYQKRKTG